MDGVPHVTNIEHYARIVKEKSLLRGLIHATAPFSSKPSKPRKMPMQSWTARNLPFFNLPKIACEWVWWDCARWYAKISTAFRSIYEEGNRITGLSTGYDQLDNLDFRSAAFRIVILAARPSMGKTALRAEYRRKCGRPRKQARGDFQPGNVQGIAAAALAFCRCARSTRTNFAPAT